MANCSICGVKLGWSSTTLTLNKYGTYVMGNEISVCDNCYSWMNKLKKGDTEAYYKVHSYMDKSSDENAISFVSKWETVPNEVKEQLEKEAKKQAEKAEIEAKEYAEKEKQKQTAISKMLISSGFHFDGYKIVKYSGYISGDDAVQIPRSGIFGSDNGKKLTDALVKIRIQALKELKEAAYALGCNAIIGVDFDYLTLEPETANLAGGTRYEPYVICVTANGNAVVIEEE